MIINNIIKSVRIQKGISQTFIAKKMGISVSGYNMKEKGRRAITTEDLENIAIALGEPASFFFNPLFHEKWNKDVG